jgi:uncharacterized damage-inducible protein DinB
MSLITKDQLLEHWQGHRRLTRRTIDTFTDNELFTFKVKKMRSFGEMMLEVLNVLEPNLRGFLTGEWFWQDKYKDIESKQALLSAWDDADAMLQDYWTRISVERLLEVEPGYFYGGSPQPHIERVLYFIDNQFHHRAQGHVYLRQLGIEPPAFYER